MHQLFNVFTQTGNGNIIEIVHYFIALLQGGSPQSVDCGHGVHIEKQKKFVKAIVAFVSEH